MLSEANKSGEVSESSEAPAKEAEPDTQSAMAQEPASEAKPANGGSSGGLEELICSPTNPHPAPALSLQGAAQHMAAVPLLPWPECQKEPAGARVLSPRTASMATPPSSSVAGVTASSCRREAVLAGDNRSSTEMNG
ncbi:unnamed protein product [Boreogadus saida]